MRQKSEDERRRIALGVSVAVTALIFVVWLSVFTTNIRSEGQVASVWTPFKAVKESLTSLKVILPEF